MRSISPAISTLIAAAAILTATPSLAQSTASGFAIDRFNPSERGSEWFFLDSLDLRGNLRPSVGLVGEFALNPLVVYNADGSTRATPVQDQLVLHPGASLVLWDRVRVGFDLPIAPYQNGSSGTVGGVTYASVGSAGVGDLRIGADVRLIGQYGDAFRLAAGAQVWVPFGDRSGYLSDGSVRVVIPRLQAAGDIGPFAYAANLGFDYRSLSETFGGTGLGSEFAFGAAIGVHALDRKLLAGPELYGSTVVTNGSAFSTANTPAELLFGAHYLAASAWRMGLAVGPGLTKGLGEPAVRFVASIEWAPQPEAPPPPPPPDRDGDGVLDADDACPDTPGVRNEDATKNGCPEEKKPPPPPPPPPPDRDKDGIVDSEDACPDVPGVKTDDPKTNGCPPDPDRDKDGIPNDQDACPDAPGKPNADPKKNGCPEAAVVGKQIVILEQVRFATGSAKLLPASDKVLNAVLTILTDHPDIKHLSIEGHTDNVGAPAMNKDLSARRAASVVAWLRQHGVEMDRLSSAGFGMERPIDTNVTAEGRQNNRRVEFHIGDGAGGDSDGRSNSHDEIHDLVASHGSSSRVVRRSDDRGVRRLRDVGGADIRARQQSVGRRLHQRRLRNGRRRRRPGQLGRYGQHQPRHHGADSADLRGAQPRRGRQGADDDDRGGKPTPIRISAMVPRCGCADTAPSARA